MASKLLKYSAMVRLLIAAFIGFILCSVAHAEGLYLTVWRYYGHENFKSSTVLGLKKVGDQFEFDRAGELDSKSYGDKDCKSLLTYNQSFPLSIMNGWGYLSQDQVEFQANVEKTVLPQQVTFTEVSNIIPATEVDEGGKYIPQSQRGKVLKKILGVPAKSIVEQKRSALWMISGRTMNPKTGQMMQHDLPWQDDPELKGDPRLLVPREKYKFIWELGRAGKTVGNIDFNLQTLVLLAYQEMKHMGADPNKEEGYFFLHSLEASRTRLFERMGAEKFPADWPNDDNCILIMKLSDRMKRIQGRARSARMNKIIQLSDNTLSNIQVLDIIDAHLTSLRNDLNFRNSGPIIFEDFSLYGYKTLLMAKLTQMGISLERAAAIFRYLAQMTSSEESENAVYENSAFIFEGWRRYIRENAVQISNLDELDVKADPDYLKNILRATYNYYGGRLATAGVIDPASSVIDRQGINFGIRTTSPYISSQLARMGSKKIAKKAKGGVTVFLHIFAATQIRAMNGQVLIPGQGSNILEPQLTEGHWYQRRLLAHPVQF